MGERKAISPRKRFDILKRDGFACHYCGERAPKATLHLDHLVPVAEGGTDNEENLIAACQNCNSGKGAQVLPGLEDFVDCGRTVSLDEDDLQRLERIGQRFHEWAERERRSWYEEWFRATYPGRDVPQFIIIPWRAFPHLEGLERKLCQSPDYRILRGFGMGIAALGSADDMCGIISLLRTRNWRAAEALAEATEEIFYGRHNA